MSGPQGADPAWQQPSSDQQPTEAPAWGQPPAYSPTQYPGYQQPGSAAPRGAPGAGQYGQPPQYGQPGQYGQPPQYGQPGQPAQYGQPPQYGQPGPYSPYQQGADGQQFSPYGAPAPGAGGSPNKTTGLILAVVGGFVLIVVIAVGVLGFWKPGWFVTTELDVKAAQSGVEQILTDGGSSGYGAKDVSDVKCNDGKNPTVAKGAEFTCDVSVDGSRRQVTVKFQDDNGTYEVGRPR